MAVRREANCLGCRMMDCIGTHLALWASGCVPSFQF